MMKVIANNWVKRFLFNIGIVKIFYPKIGSIHFGDFCRTTPLSRTWGADRGGAIDRVYIEQFLKINSPLIKGRVLEVASNSYTMKYGGLNVSQSDVLHVNSNHPTATIIADLGQPLPQLGENLFDCIILTQTLQFIYDYRKAIENCYKLLKPGGHLLLTVPGISHIGRDPYNWYWSFTTYSIEKIFAEQFKKENFKVKSYGNVLAASGFLYGVGRNEIEEEKIDVNDPSYQMIIAVSARK